MEKVASSFNFSNIEKIMRLMEVSHSENDLNNLKKELNKFFIKCQCRQVLYTNNTDKLFFGMRVYVVCDGNKAAQILFDDKVKPFDAYYLELDSKLFDPMLGLNEKELTAILLHEVGHIAYDTGTIDEVRKQVDIYFTKNADVLNHNASKNYYDLLAFAMKDSVIKVGSIFSKIGNDEIIADSFVYGCGYGEYLESAMKKILNSSTYLNKSVDNRLITMGWVLRMNREFKIRRIPAIRTLNKAKYLTASKLEERELAYAENLMNNMKDPLSEASFIDNIKARFSKKFMDFKRNGVRGIKGDVYELNVQVRCATTEEDLLYIVRTANTDISILKDYLLEDISDTERSEVLKTLEELYAVREKAAKNQEVQKMDSLIQVVYPNM